MMTKLPEPVEIEGVTFTFETITCMEGKGLYHDQTCDTEISWARFIGRTNYERSGSKRVGVCLTHLPEADMETLTGHIRYHAAQMVKAAAAYTQSGVDARVRRAAPQMLAAIKAALVGDYTLLEAARQAAEGA